MKPQSKKFPKWWWVPFTGIVGLLVLGTATVAVVWTGGLVTDAEKARLPVERGDATIPQLDEALRLNPDYLMAYTRRARLRFAAGQYDASVADIDRALELSPENQELLQLRAEVRRTRSRSTQASSPP